MLLSIQELVLELIPVISIIQFADLDSNRLMNHLTSHYNLTKFLTISRISLIQTDILYITL